jgi:hypothetical protein
VPQVRGRHGGRARVLPPPHPGVAPLKVHANDRHQFFQCHLSDCHFFPNVTCLNVICPNVIFLNVFFPNVICPNVIVALSTVSIVRMSFVQMSIVRMSFVRMSCVYVLNNRGRFLNRFQLQNLKSANSIVLT